MTKIENFDGAAAHSGLSLQELTPDEFREVSMYLSEVGVTDVEVGRIVVHMFQHRNVEHEDTIRTFTVRDTDGNRYGIVCFIPQHMSNDLTITQEKTDKYLVKVFGIEEDEAVDKMIDNELIRMGREPDSVLKERVI
jgi:alcohol dehydrogenase YqhD (iron-dependent ADH family)